MENCLQIVTETILIKIHKMFSIYIDLFNDCLKLMVMSLYKYCKSTKYVLKLLKAF